MMYVLYALGKVCMYIYIVCVWYTNKHKIYHVFMYVYVNIYVYVSMYTRTHTNISHHTRIMYTWDIWKSWRTNHLTHDTIIQILRTVFHTNSEKTIQTTPSFQLTNKKKNRLHSLVFIAQNIFFWSQDLFSLALSHRVMAGEQGHQQEASLNAEIIPDLHLTWSCSSN